MKEARYGKQICSGAEKISAHTHGRDLHGEAADGYPEPDTLFGGFPEPEEEMPSGVLLVPDEDADTEMTVMEKIMREELRKAVRSLPPGERALIISLYLKEEPLSEKEYAERVGARRGQVNSMKEKVLEKLRDTLSGRARREPRRLS